MASVMSPCSAVSLSFEARILSEQVRMGMGLESSRMPILIMWRVTDAPAHRPMLLNARGSVEIQRQAAISFTHAALLALLAALLLHACCVVFDFSTTKRQVIHFIRQLDDEERA